MYELPNGTMYKCIKLNQTEYDAVLAGNRTKIECVNDMIPLNSENLPLKLLTLIFLVAFYN